MSDGVGDYPMDFFYVVRQIKKLKQKESGVQKEMDMEYDKIIDMLCLTGKLPVNMVDSVCEYAKQSIVDALKVADGNAESRKAKREELLFGDVASFKADYKSAWFDYEVENMANFSMS